MKRYTLFIFLIAMTIHLSSQVVEGFDFEKYPAVTSSKSIKAKLKLHTNPFKSREKDIVELYTNSSINFGGNYIFTIWSNDSIGSQGVMIDIRDGQIYKLPFSKETVGNHCIVTEDVFDRYLFFANSRLLVTSVCKESKINGKIKVRQTFFFYAWNETTKKFTLLKRLEKSRSI